MKFKMFLRGLGTGIIFATFIMLVAYLSNGKFKASDKEVIDRAKELGMEFTEEQINEEQSAGETTEEITAEENTTEEKTTEKQTTEEKTTEEKTTEVKTTEEKTTEEKTTEKQTTEETGKDKTTKEKKDNSLVKSKITIKSGMDSVEVCKIIQDAGIIDDYMDFDNYLNSNNYSTKIRVGSFELNSDMTYEEIANILTK